MKLVLALVLSTLALIGARLRAEDPDPRWRRIVPPLVLDLSRDFGNHPDTLTEWWYFTGELDAGARHFGWQLTIFRIGLDPSPPLAGESDLRARHVLAGHLVLVDVEEQRTRHAERSRRMDGYLAFSRENELNVALDDLELVRTPDGLVHARGSDRANGFALDLVLAAQKPVVMHGVDNVSQKGPERGNASGYMSITRLATSGVLHLDGAALDVSGESWFDHEWGTSQLGAGVVGWDWTGMRLEDGRELMVYRLRRADGSFTEESAGTLVERDGTARHLAVSDFQLTPLSTWTSTRTNAVWPVRWHVVVPSAAIDAEIRARVDDCELDARASTGTVYWEGPATIAGTARGSGYLELVGYAGSMEGRF